MLSTVEFQAPKKQFSCNLIDGNVIYISNGEDLFVIDFSFFNKFSIKNFDIFKQNFQVGLRNNIRAKKITTGSGYVDVLAVCPIDKNNFFIFNSIIF